VQGAGERPRLPESSANCAVVAGVETAGALIGDESPSFDLEDLKALDRKPPRVFARAAGGDVFLAGSTGSGCSMTAGDNGGAKTPIEGFVVGA